MFFFFCHFLLKLFSSLYFLFFFFFVALRPPENWLKSKGRKETKFCCRIGRIRARNRPVHFSFFVFFLPFFHLSRVEFLNFQKTMFWSKSPPYGGGGEGDEVSAQLWISRER